MFSKLGGAAAWLGSSKIGREGVGGVMREEAGRGSSMASELNMHVTCILYKE